MVGVDNVPVEPLPRLNHVAPRMLTTIQNRRRLARRALAARGLDEAVTWSLHLATPRPPASAAARPSCKLANAIASDMTDMRPSLLPGLLAAARRNANRGFATWSCSKSARCSFGARPRASTPMPRASAPARPRSTGQAATGPASRSVGVFDAKADLAAAARCPGLRHRQGAARRRSRAAGAIPAAAAASARAQVPSAGSANSIRPGLAELDLDWPRRRLRARPRCPARTAQEADPHQAGARTLPT